MNIETIIERAKEMFLQEGEFPPTHFIELNGDDYLILAAPQLEAMETSVERARMKFFMGRTFAQRLLKKKKYKKSRVTGVCEVTEVWFNGGEEHTPPTVRPSLDPARREALSIVFLDAQTHQEKMTMYEILRDGSGKVTDLLKLTSFGDDEIYSMGLPALLAGVRTAQQHESQAIHEFRRIVERYAAFFLSH